LAEIIFSKKQIGNNYQGATKMANIVLKAEVLHSGTGCPICGGQKTKRARTCAACRKEHGDVATSAVDKIAEAAEMTKSGHEAALKGGIERNIKFGPVLAQVKIAKDAESHPTNGDIQGYWEGRFNVPGRFFQIFIFGEQLEQGKTYAALIELKTRVPKTGPMKDKEVYYFRAQVIGTENGIYSDTKIAIVPGIEAGKLNSNLPRSERIEVLDKDGEKNHYIIGFIPTTQPKPAQTTATTEQPAAHN
jgi:hypothetical protein